MEHAQRDFHQGVIMLVLSRKSGEGIVIDVPGCEPIIISIKDLTPNRAKVVIQADPEVRVARQELAAKNAPAEPHLV